MNTHFVGEQQVSTTWRLRRYANGRNIKRWAYSIEGIISSYRFNSEAGALRAAESDLGMTA